MRVGLNIPKRVIPHRILVTRHLLLFKRPIRQLDLVREQITPRQRMPQLELGPKRLHSPIPPRTLIDLDNPVIVRVTLEARVSVRADLVLEFNVRDRWAHVVRVETFGGGDVFEADGHAVADRDEGLSRPVVVGDAVKCSVDDAPVIVAVDVGVEGDLLFYMRKA